MTHLEIENQQQFNLAVVEALSNLGSVAINKNPTSALNSFSQVLGELHEYVQREPDDLDPLIFAIVSGL